MSRPTRGAALAVTLSLAACSGGTKYIGSNATDTEEPGASTHCAAPSAPPAELALDPFYTKYTDARGIPVVSSGNVSDLALERACDIATHVLGKRDDVHALLVASGLRVAVIAEDEVMSDIPEYRDIYATSPGFDWDRLARGTGPAPSESAEPVASAGEENLLCDSPDLFLGEVLLVFSLAHALRSFGILELDPNWDARLRSAYSAAMDAGLWQGTHASSSAAQYWAEGVQDWFNANRESDGVHNEVNTRAELEAYDPALAALIAEYLPDDPWTPPCRAVPNQR